ncbi:hypothetical protein [Verrucomicrobium sp. BvORR106]|uniref:hypothetical protein n=1 Tax=Verrucomicrobium sp. BvORR106 TaxID=1403819 RepID=UPI00056E2E00|nr:hypothetical protein [Verrucomicrobium sp. BvORR106]
MFSSGARLGLAEMLVIAAIGGTIIFLLSFFKWKLAVKTAFVLVLFEGAIRKWVLPGQQEVVYFIKDFVLAGAYVRFFLFPDPEVRARNLAAPLFLVSLLCAIVAISAINPNIQSALIAIYGLKIYFYYIPLAFMIPHLYRNHEDLTRGITRYALIATPICLLGIAQFAVPSSSILNIYAENLEDSVITTFAGTSTARITGTFSYLTGHTTFVVISFALHLCLLGTKQPRYRWFWLVANLPLLIANAFMGGSRACVVSIVSITLGYMALGLMYGGKQLFNRIWVVAVAAVVASLVSLVIFSEALDQWKTRHLNASDTYWERIYSGPMKSLTEAMDSNGMLGFGIGVSHPVSYRLRSALDLPPALREPPMFDTEPARVLVELGVAGFLAWYALRLLVLKNTFTTFKLLPTGDLKSLVLAALLIQPPFFLMSMVLNHTASFLLWGAYGLSLTPWLSQAHPMRNRSSPSPTPAGTGPAAATPAFPNRRPSR